MTGLIVAVASWWATQAHDPARPTRRDAPGRVIRIAVVACHPAPHSVPPEMA